MASADKSSIVLGIDIGSDKCVVAFVDKKGVVDALQNEASKRETPVVVHFDKRQRLFGSAGAARANMDPKSTISQLKRLIGRRYDEPSFQKEGTLLPYETSSGADGEVTVNVWYCDKACQFTAVEMLGMFLCHLKRMADKAIGSTVSECVIGIPSYFTDRQRRDYLLAAEVAGLKPLRLFHDGAATALDYGLHRNLPHGVATNVVFVDIGHGDIQVTVVRFCFGTATVLAHSFDRDLGGRDFDDAIFESFAEKFKQQYGLNVRENPKATFRLRTACEKAKKVLSSNSEAQINIECLVGDNDLVGVITRTEFENLSSDLLERIIGACKRALTDTDLIKKEIHSVELVGSGSRIPKIADVLRDFFGRETSRTLNGSECIANGCALQCAMLNGAPGAGNFGVHDRMPFSVVGSSACMNSSTPTSIIHKGSFLLSPRMLTLCPSESVTISYANLNDLPDGVSPDIMCYKVACGNATDKYNLEIRVQFSIHGTIDVKSASLKPITEALGLPESLNSSEKVSQNFNSSVEESGKAREFEHSSEIKVQGDKFDATALICRDFSKQLLDVKISEVPNLETCTQNVLEKAKNLESTLTEQDKAIERAKNRRNDLEAYMYQARDQLSRGFGNLASKSRRDDVTNMLNLTGVWLDETSTEEPETTYTKKMSELQSALRHLQEEHLNISKENEKKANFITYTNKKMDALASKFKDCLGAADKSILNTMRHDIKSFVEGDGIIPEEEYRKRSERVDWHLGQIEGRCIEESSRSRQTGALGWISNNLFGKSPVPAAPTMNLKDSLHTPHYSSQTDTSQHSLDAACPTDGKHNVLDDTPSPSAPEQISHQDVVMSEATDDAIASESNVLVGKQNRGGRDPTSDWISMHQAAMSLVRLPLTPSGNRGLLQEDAFLGRWAPPVGERRDLWTRRRRAATVVEAKGKRAGGMMSRQYQRQPPPPLPKLEDDGNPKFVIFIRTANVYLWYPLSVVTGGTTAKIMVAAKDNLLGKYIYKDTIARNIAAVIYRDEKEIQKSAFRQFRVLRSATSFKYGYKLVENNNLRAALATSDVIELPSEEELKTVVDKVKDFFGGAASNVKESFGKMTLLDTSTEGSESKPEVKS